MKILMVSMASLHFFKWAEQLENAGHEVYWFDVIDSKQKVSKITWINQIVDWRLRWDYPGRYFMKKKFNRLAKKYGVKSWTYVPSNTMINSDGKIYSVQAVKDIEDLFRLGTGKYVYIYHSNIRLGGFITDEEQK